MTMGSKRRYNECLCNWCAESGSRWRSFVKKYTRRQDRVEAKHQIREQLDDWQFGVNPD